MTAATIYKIFFEKATREQYRINAFKKKFDFKPDKPGSKQGTINVDGKRYRIDIDVHNRNMIYTDDRGSKVIRRYSTGEIASENPTVHLSKNVFKHKHPKSVDAEALHEIGHTKLHNINAKYDNNAAKGVIMDEIKNAISKAAIKYPEADLNNIKRQILNNPLFINKAIAIKSKPEREQLVRDYAYSLAKKYESNKIPHANAKEFEADRFSANRTSEKDVLNALKDAHCDSKKKREILLKKAISNINALCAAEELKIRKSDASNKDDLINELRKERNERIDAVKNNTKNSNRMDAEEYQIRKAALKDHDLKNNSVYK